METMDLFSLSLEYDFTYHFIKKKETESTANTTQRTGNHAGGGHQHTATTKQSKNRKKESSTKPNNATLRGKLQQHKVPTQEMSPWG
jgi:hypothetical protein